MTKAHNPYASALDGLVLEDPVAAFFDFCREREAIRLARERGESAPWSHDPVFQRGRFLNVFREDDRVTKAILRFHERLDLAPEDLERRVQAALFARWCNRDATLDVLRCEPGVLDRPSEFRNLLETLPEQPWCNATAYPVEPVRWEGRLHSRIRTATELFHRLKQPLCDAVRSAQGDVIGATKAVNGLLGMSNDFPIFMAMVDLAWFRPDVIDPASPVPTGIGAVAFLDRLEAHLGLDDHQATCERMIALQPEYWPEAKRAFQPIDIEYLSCECRKYYSYVNGTKAFEGKNVFHPGQSPRLLWDIPTPAEPFTPIQTRIQVIAGAPCSGKTTLLRALAAQGHRVERETAELLLEEAVARGERADERRADPVAWQQELLQRDFELFDGLPTDELIYADTSIIGTLAYSHRAGLVEGANLAAWLRAKRYQRVFFLEPVGDYKKSAVRRESSNLASQLSENVKACYRRYGYEVISVPGGSVEERLKIIQRYAGVAH